MLRQVLRRDAVGTDHESFDDLLRPIVFVGKEVRQRKRCVARRLCAPRKRCTAGSCNDSLYGSSP
jgi:hypothetical protein